MPKEFCIVKEYELQLDLQALQDKFVKVLKYG